MKDVDPMEKFRIPPLPHTGLFGVFLGVHAVSDALNVLHAGVGCKGKTQRQLVDHDRGLDAHSRVGWTELREENLIRDAGQPLLTGIRELARRRKPNVIMLSASAAVEFSGLDLQTYADTSGTEVGCPVLSVPKAAFLSDLYAGYAAVVREMLSLVPWERPAPDDSMIGIIGHFFHRHEMEQAANLSELRRLIEGIGLRAGPIFLSGKPLGELQKIQRANLLVNLPYSGMNASELTGLTGRRVIDCGLPLGLRATGTWLHALGGQSKAFIGREESRVAARLRPFRRALDGRRVAVVADTPAAAGWTLLVQELGLRPVLVALIDRSLGGSTTYKRFVAKAGGEIPHAMRLIEGASVAELRTAGDSCQFDLAIRPDLDLSNSRWQDVPTLEAGFPANHKHFVYPMPELGYTGAVAMAQRLMNALSGVA